MELNFLSLDLARVDAEIASAAASGADPSPELQKHRAELAQKIAHFDTAP
jgi:hypothetical protein